MSPRDRYPDQAICYTPPAATASPSRTALGGSPVPLPVRDLDDEPGRITLVENWFEPFR